MRCEIDMQPEQPPLLVVESLSLSLPGGAAILRNVSLRVGQGEIVAVVGESGSGKTQLLLTLLGLGVRGAVDGSAVFKSQSLIGASESRLQAVRGKQIAMLFQDPMTALNPYLRVGVQLQESIPAQASMSRQESSARAREALIAVDMPQPELHLRQYPHQLSGGMRQRVMMAMAILGKPDLLLADEPTTSLDVTTQSTVLDLLLLLRQRLEMAVLIVTHDLGVVARVADRVAVMRQGAIVEQGTVESVFTQPQHEYTAQLLASARRLSAGAS
jgi:ABC-type glutathione transport system ATPase component